MCILMVNDFIDSVCLHCDYKRFSVSKSLKLTGRTPNMTRSMIG